MYRKLIGVGEALRTEYTTVVDGAMVRVLQNPSGFVSTGETSIAVLESLRDYTLKQAMQDREVVMFREQIQNRYKEKVGDLLSDPAYKCNPLVDQLRAGKSLQEVVEQMTDRTTMPRFSVTGETRRRYNVQVSDLTQVVERAKSLQVHSPIGLSGPGGWISMPLYMVGGTAGYDLLARHFKFGAVNVLHTDVPMHYIAGAVALLLLTLGPINYFRDRGELKKEQTNLIEDAKDFDRRLKCMPENVLH